MFNNYAKQIFGNTEDAMEILALISDNASFAVIMLTSARFFQSLKLPQSFWYGFTILIKKNSPIKHKHVKCTIFAGEKAWDWQEILFNFFTVYKQIHYGAAKICVHTEILSKMRFSSHCLECIFFFVQRASHYII